MADVDYHRLDEETPAEWLRRLEAVDPDGLEPVQQQTLDLAKRSARRAVELAGNEEGSGDD